MWFCSRLFAALDLHCISCAVEKRSHINCLPLCSIRLSSFGRDRKRGRMMQLRWSSLAVATALAGAIPLLGGCEKPKAAAATETAPEVGVVSAQTRQIALVRELPGRVAPTRVADVRPRVSGILVERRFRQGSDVAPGETLYQIDPRPFEVELQAAEAALAKAKAALRLAVQQSTRAAALLARQAASESQHEMAVAATRQAEAEVAAREADIARAKLHLDYATIRAPIGGRIGPALASEGALVVQNDTANLATIQQLDPIYADFTQSVSELTKLRRAFDRGDLERIAPQTATVKLVLDDGTVYPLDGKLLFSGARVDATTGQVTLRGEFPNPQAELLPGMYVRVRIEQGIDTDAFALPEQAIQRNGTGGSEVYVVKDDGRVAVQSVRVGPGQDGQAVVLDGLKGGENIVVEGFQKFAPGDKVKPRPWADDSARN
jgi:membrane fusion protein (multidrug efflux system)